MNIAQVQFTSWDRVYNFETNNLDLSEGDRVIAKTDVGQDIALVLKILNEAEEGIEVESDPIIRLASVDDLERMPSEKEKSDTLKFAISAKEKHNLPMKFVDVHFASDGSKITFAFIADGRVDFREMVKELTRHFSKSIRLQQIGIRDEARISGDCGHCGKTLCCKTHLKNLSSITSEMAELQECSHRGSDRISGVCGRLLCCLAYEQKGYEELAEKMPQLGAKVNVDGKKGIVVGLHPMRRSVNVDFANPKNPDERNIQEIDLDRNKK